MDVDVASERATLEDYQIANWCRITSDQGSDYTVSSCRRFRTQQSIHFTHAECCAPNELMRTRNTWIAKVLRKKPILR